MKKPNRKLKLEELYTGPELKPAPIIVVPDKSYIGDSGNIIPTDVILVVDPTIYERMKSVLGIWEKVEMGVAGQIGDIVG